MKQYETGAKREDKTNKGRYDLIPQEAMHRLALRYEEGAAIHGDNNWRKGIPNSVHMNALIRHAFQASAGMTDEDHIAAVAWNACAIMYNEKHFKGNERICDIKPSNYFKIDLELFKKKIEDEAEQEIKEGGYK